MKKKFLSSSLSILILVIIGMTIAVGVPAYFWTKTHVTKERVQNRSKLYPVILVPGSSATENRFDGLISKLNTGNKKQSLLKITVKTNNQLRISGRIFPRDTRPFIVIAFENNHDGYQNIQRQAKWMSVAMTYLTKKYQFNHFSGIGHSNGGLIYTLYLEKYMDQNQLLLDRLMTIGTPYNFSETNMNQRTNILKELIAGKEKLPRNLTVYSIDGTTNYTTDGIVPSTSVSTGKYIFQNQVAQYTKITVTGKDSQHSDLPQNREIIQLINENILQTGNGATSNITQNATPQ
ncbi:alpha/beta hydrolase [Liquorilactobacillus uvarum]|uniref:Alpha beta hydrolase superfamily protein n=1 Tax=Liquorilactobacillus uvarum DSM 19971 TaxID=1423812 RepID=A0A0R1Q9C0_9LACO|nr:alpha/beta hydrolase [Liquorilactobacillus uvarum]KRL37867.1 alpha beta hydrolase superfamily protein [Liquorilactobacillus uvarum DSM 19971]